MLKQVCAITLFFALFTTCSFAKEVIWNGQVPSDGTPTGAIDLTLHKKYQFIVSGTMNLGKWVQAGQPLSDDAGFEFNSSLGPKRLNTFRNSSDIPLDNTTFHPDHIYKSIPFTAMQNKIHFWIEDEDYSDNTGSLNIQLVQLD